MSMSKQNGKHAVEGEIENLREAAHQAGRSVRNFYNSATDEAGNVAEAVKDEIRNHPIRASLIALAAGFVLGFALRK